MAHAGRQDRVARRRGVERKTDRPQVAVGRPRHPRIRRAPEVAAVCRGATRAVAEVRPRIGKARPPGVADPRHEPVRTAVRPAILLPEPRDIVGIGRAHRHPRFGLGVRVVEVGARGVPFRCTAAARRERRGDADVVGRSHRERPGSGRRRRRDGERHGPKRKEQASHDPSPPPEHFPRPPIQRLVADRAFA